MFSKLSLSVVIVLTLFANSSSLSQVQRSPAKNDDGWTTLTVGQSAYGIRYDQSGAVVVNSNLVMACLPDAPGSEAGLNVFRPSPLKKYALVVCSKYAGDEAYIIDTAHNRVASRDIVPKHWQIMNWISWSPDERFALVAADGEITMGDMAFVDLTSGTVREIQFKNFTNARGIDPRNTPYERLQDFDPDKVGWISPTSFHFNMVVRCNPFERGEGCYDKIISTHPVEVNLSPFRIAYVVTAASLRAPTTERKPSTRFPSQVSGADDCKFCGLWKAVVGGRLMGRRADDYAGKTGNPYCGCDYLKITKAAPGKLKLSIGSEYQGNINWYADGDKVINNADAIYLRPVNGTLVARFVSPNFYATHGMDFTYQITSELKGANEMVFSVWCSIRGGETEKATFVKINE